MEYKSIGFFDRLSTMSKAIAGGGLIALPGLTTVLNALVAAAGIGIMPEAVELQAAIVNLVMAIGGGLLIYTVPNATIVNEVDEVVAGPEPMTMTREDPSEAKFEIEESVQ